jgi:hypothetical protein
MKKAIGIAGIGILTILFLAGCSKDNGNNPPLTYSVIRAG